MTLTTISDIITHQVLNEETGELESKEFKEIKKKSIIRGGFRMVYKSYDEAVIEVIRSKLDLETLVYIRDMFTFNRIENVLSKVDLAKKLGTSEQKVSTIIRRMLESGLIKRVSRGVYRLNPFMYVPYRANGSVLQKEWAEIK